MTDEDALTDVISLLAISRHRLMAGALDAGARPVHHQGDQVSTYIYLFCLDRSPDILADGESGQHLRNLTHPNVNTQQPTTKEAHMTMTDPTTTTLPNLPAWYPVPPGATIPEGTPYAYAYVGGVTVKMDGSPYDITVHDGSNPCYTEHPIAPPLQTEEGAKILASGNDLPPHTLLTYKGGRWVTCYGAEWAVKITSWCPVAVGETVVMP